MPEHAFMVREDVYLLLRLQAQSIALIDCVPCRGGTSKHRHRGTAKLENSKRNRSGPDLSMRAGGF